MGAEFHPEQNRRDIFSGSEQRDRQRFGKLNQYGAMKLFWSLMGLALAGKNADRKRLNKERQEMFKNEVTAEALRELTEVMNFEDFDLANFIPQIYDAYLMDHPEKREHFDELAGDYQPGDLMRANGFRSDETGLESRMNGLTQADKMHIMKYMQLKFSITFLQKNKMVGRYCFYGCWCLPVGAGKAMMGYGVPVDDIDRSCREYTTCYNCLYNQEINGERCDEWAAMQQRYRITGNQDPTTGAITLFCQDPQGSCARSRCECDKALSEKLSDHENKWNMANHHKWGNPPFNRQLSCQPTKAAIHTAQVAAEAVQKAQLEEVTFDPNKDQGWKGSGSGLVGGGGGSFGGGNGKDSVNKLVNILSSITDEHKEVNEGGDLILHIQKGGNGGKQKITQIVQSAPIYGPIAGCCGRAPNVHYYREGQRCCVDGEIVDLTAPCTMDFS